LANKGHIKIGNKIKINQNNQIKRQNGNENYKYINNVKNNIEDNMKNNIDVRSQKGKSKCVSVGTNSSLEDEKQWSQDKNQSLKSCR